MNKLKTLLPWQIKMFIKICFSQLGMTDFLLKTRVFRHGEMDNLNYAFNVFEKHFLRAKKYLPKEQGFTVLEIGPGDSLFSAIIAQAYGASFTYLVDVENFAKEEMSEFGKMIDFLKQKGLRVPKIPAGTQTKDLSTIYHYRYLTNGLNSLRTIPSNSIDFIFSTATLEHIHKNEFLKTMRELKRILKTNGICSHEVDLKDHLGSSLNNLRFSEKLWERDLIYNSSFYTNRIRFSDMLNVFKKAGFKYQILKIKKFDRMPLARNKLSFQFRSLPEEDLLTSGLEVLLFPDSSLGVN
ncbi:methyltransferase domain-containing protein [Patescibacteria group bacterium AH-259-L07]|nr:methyltransferase domain-containing protein [Patescibacteria group bacterium AH-259-L07]